MNCFGVRTDLEYDPAVILHRNAKFLIPGNIVPGSFCHRPDGNIQPLVLVGPPQRGGIDRGAAVDIQPSVAVQRDAALIFVGEHQHAADLTAVVSPHQNPCAGQQILIGDAVAGEIGGYLRVLPDLIRCAVRQGNGHPAFFRDAETYQPVGTDDHIILRHFVICRDVYQQQLRGGLRRQAHGRHAPGTHPCVNRLAGFDGVCVYGTAADGVQNHGVLRPENNAVGGLRLTGLLHQQAAVVLPGDGATDNGILGIGDIGSCAGGILLAGGQRGDAQHGGTQQGGKNLL